MQKETRPAPSSDRDPSGQAPRRFIDGPEKRRVPLSRTHAEEEAALAAEIEKLRG
jgi:hypothetical protein